MVRLLIPMLAIVLLTGCSVRQPLPQLAGEQIEGAAVKEAIDESAARRASVARYRALMRMTIAHGKEQNSFRQVLVFEHPDKLRLETLPLTAPYALNLLLARGGELLYLDAQEKRALRGQDNAESVGKVLPLPLDAAAAAELILGILPHSVRGSEMRIYRDSERRYLQLISADNSEYYEINMLDSTVRRAEFRRGSRLTVRVVLDAFALVGDTAIPADVRIELPQDDVTIQMRLIKSEIDPQLPARVFEAVVPAEYELRTIGE